MRFTYGKMSVVGSAYMISGNTPYLAPRQIRSRAPFEVAFVKLNSTLTKIDVILKSAQQDAILAEFSIWYPNLKI